MNGSSDTLEPSRLAADRSSTKLNEQYSVSDLPDTAMVPRNIHRKIVTSGTAPFSDKQASSYAVAEANDTEMPSFGMNTKNHTANVSSRVLIFGQAEAK